MNWFIKEKNLSAHDFSRSFRIAILTCVTVKNCSLLCFIIRGVRFRYIFRHPRACKHLVAFHIYLVGKQIDILTYIFIFYSNLRSLVYKAKVRVENERKKNLSSTTLDG
jgi:hypothetical protein